MKDAAFWIGYGTGLLNAGLCGLTVSNPFHAAALCAAMGVALLAVIAIYQARKRSASK